MSGVLGMAPPLSIRHTRTVLPALPLQVTVTLAVVSRCAVGVPIVPNESGCTDRSQLWALAVAGHSSSDVATITQEADAYAADVVAALKRAGMRVEADLRNEKITYKVREHSTAKVPVILVLGKREAAERTVNMRRLGSQEQRSMTLDEAVAALGAEAVPPDLKRAGAAA